MLKFCFLTLFIASLSNAIAQPNVVPLEKADIPSSIKYNGKLIYAVKYSDSLGNNIFIATETGEAKSKNISADGEDGKDASLYAYHFIILKDSAKLVWKLTDYERECPFDISVSFIQKAFEITDIDKDGKNEIWLMYLTACRSDVSPATLKLFMYENGAKAGMRGTTKTQIGEHQFMGGNYSFDDSFKKMPNTFREHAIELWKKYYREKWE